MKRISQNIFEDQVSDTCSITLDCKKNKATVKHSDHYVSFNYTHPITMDDYAKLRNNIEKKIKEN